MRVYELFVTEDHEVVVPDGDDPGDVQEMTGKTQGSSWTPLPVTLLREDEGVTYLPATMPAFSGGGLLGFRADALEGFRGVISPFGEELALDCPDADLVAFNVTTVLDALDEERSNLARFASDGRVMYVRDHAFRPEALPDLCLFQVPQDPGTLLCTEAVAELFRQARPTGTRLRLLWEHP